MIVCGNEYKIFELNEDALAMNIDFAIFSAGGEVSKYWVKRFVETGVVVIDNTSVFRLDKKVPLIVPEINLDMVKKDDYIIANPNCSTIQLVVVLDRLKCLSRIDEVIVSTYQSVSGAGRKALYDLRNCTSHFFDKGIKNNFIAAIGEVDKQGFCGEEQKLMRETGKILNDKNIKVVATAVRVPIANCHGESVVLRFEKDVKLKDVISALKCDYISICKDFIVYPTDVCGTNQTWVCRLRQVSKNEIAFFVIADNLRRGAAYNAVKILKKIIDFKV
jgi:aspartate-semialdehyde dehydrogenase